MTTATFLRIAAGFGCAALLSAADPLPVISVSLVEGHAYRNWYYPGKVRLTLDRPFATRTQLSFSWSGTAVPGTTLNQVGADYLATMPYIDAGVTTLDVPIQCWDDAALTLQYEKTIQLRVVSGAKWTAHPSQNQALIKLYDDCYKLPLASYVSLPAKSCCRMATPSPRWAILPATRPIPTATATPCPAATSRPLPPPSCAAARLAT